MKTLLILLALCAIGVESSTPILDYKYKIKSNHSTPILDYKYKIKSNHSFEEDQFGLSIDGRNGSLAIGVPGARNFTGHVMVDENSIISGRKPGSFFGEKISVNKDYIVVAARGEATYAKVHIYSSAASSKPYELVHTITMGNSNCIWDVRIGEDDTIVLVSYLNDTHRRYSPMIIYERQGRSWEQTFAYKWNSSVLPVQLTISGHHIAVAKITESNKRFVDTFRRTGDQWNINQSIEVPNCETCDMNIFSIDLLDEKMVISAMWDLLSQDDPGQFVYRFDNASGMWIQDGIPIYDILPFNLLWDKEYYNPKSAAIQGDLVALIGGWFGSLGVFVYKRRDNSGFVEWLPYVKLKMNENEVYFASNVILDGNMVYVSCVEYEDNENAPGFVNVYDLNQIHSLV